eukprot:NODE_625_length_5289_cov_0.416956.p5 type:complete len:132 gc:universal NODE_625_length_5289_cov_0.416956:4579-4974(+)
MTSLTKSMATPLASEKLEKKITKTMKKGFKCFSLRRGVKEVNKALRKDEIGIVVIAANTTPVDLISHLPLLCEEKNIPYVFVQDKGHLGELSHSNQSVVACMLTKKGRKTAEQSSIADYTESLEGLIKEVK